MIGTKTNKRILISIIDRYIKGGGRFWWRRGIGIFLDCAVYSRCSFCPIQRTRLEPAKYTFIPYNCFGREEEGPTMESIINQPEIKKILIYLGYVRGHK